MANQVPLVDYLVLGDDPHLVAHECTSCGSRYFGRRNACAPCFGTEFKDVRVPNEGTPPDLHHCRPGCARVPVPFVSGIVDCDTTPVRANVINTDPTPESIKLVMKLKLATFLMGTDGAGTEAVGFGYEPVS